MPGAAAGPKQKSTSALRAAAGQFNTRSNKNGETNTATASKDRTAHQPRPKQVQNTRNKSSAPEMKPRKNTTKNSALTAPETSRRTLERNVRAEKEIANVNAKATTAPEL